MKDQIIVSDDKRKRITGLLCDELEIIVHQFAIAHFSNINARRVNIHLADFSKVYFDRCAVTQLEIKGNFRNNLIVSKESVAWFFHARNANVAIRRSHMISATFDDCDVELLHSGFFMLNGRKSKFTGDALIDEYDDISCDTSKLVSCGTPPRVGPFTMWKMTLAEDSHMPVLVELRVPKGALRVGFSNVRVNKARVVSITDIDTGRQYKAAVASYDKSFRYVVGKMVHSGFATNATTCDSGIHGYLSKEMALAYKI